jgi:two-component system cell cycle sensor histidine kinase/response regulator CckA
MGKPLRVLVVEDSEDDALLVMRELRRNGYDPTFDRVETSEAMKAVLTRQTWDVVISDYRMPRFSAPAALALLTETGIDLPFIVISGTIGEETAVETMKAGAHDYLMKDNLNRLVPAIDRELREAQVRRERKRTEEELHLSEQRYRSLIDSARDVIYTLSPDGMISSLNPAFEAITGWLRDEWIGKSFTSIIHPDDRTVAEKLHFLSLQGELPPLLELRILTKRNDFVIGEFLSVPQLEQGRVVQILGIGRDITKRKQAEERVLRQKAMLEGINKILRETLMSEHEKDIARTFLDVAQQLTDSKLGFVCEINQSGRLGTIAISDLGWDACSISKETGNLMVNDMEIRGIRGKVIQEGRSMIFNEPASHPDWISTPEGHPAITCFMGIPLKREGRILGMIALANKEHGYDIADQEDLETLSISFVEALNRNREARDRESLLEQFRQAQKMEAVGKLAGGIAHDFNNLITIIKGYGQISIDELKEGDPLKANLREIHKAAERAAALTRQLLAFSRRQIMEMKILNINGILADIEKMLRRIIGEDIQLVTVLAEDVGSVKSDPGQIEQVILNLAVNAKDAMPSGGTLTIETANAELDEAYARHHAAVTPGLYVMVSVSDTGVGMTQEVRERVFEPFFTTKEMGKGTGLGLSTVYGIVKQSGGNIWVYSEPGMGTTFKIYLPRVDEPLSEMESRVIVEELPFGSQTILIVEDEDEVRRLATLILRKQGYNVLEASNGGEALLICERHKSPIDLLLTDVVMPGMSGREVAKRLARLHQVMKVLYMSGYTDNAVAHHGILEKGIAYIQKPFTVRDLAAKVREVLDKD